MDAWVVEALRVGYRISFDRRPPLSELPLSLPAYSPQSIEGVALTQELQTLLRKGAVEPAPQSPGFYSRLFLVQKASGSWRPIIDLSTLNDYITSSHFHMETPQSVLRSIRPGDWMVSLDLQDAYLQVPVHHDSRCNLRFVVAGKSYQFRVLCFGLTTAPQVFTRIMAPVSTILHKYGVRIIEQLHRQRLRQSYARSWVMVNPRRGPLRAAVNISPKVKAWEKWPVTSWPRLLLPQMMSTYRHS